MLANLLKLRQVADTHRYLAGAAILALALLAYANSFPGAFILDDHAIVEFNPLLSSFDPIAILRSEYWGENLHSGLYRPLAIFSLALNQALFGPAPWTFHLINLLLHAGTALLLFIVLRRWDFSAAIALLAAAIFAVHPLHSEVVNEVIGRSELLAALFTLAALAFARRTGRGHDLLVIISFLLALLSKEHTITLLVILPLFDAFAKKSWRIWRRRWRLYAGLLVGAVLWLTWKEFGVLHTGRPEIPHPLFVPLYYLSPFDRVVAALQLQWLYLGRLLLPLQQQAVYSGSNFFTPGLKTISPLAWMSIGGVFTLIGLVMTGMRRWNPLAFSFLLYLLAVLPTANILFPISVNFAERLMYFPSLWFSLFCAVALAALLRNVSNPKVYRLTGGLYVTLLLTLCLARNPAFADEIHLWRSEVQSDPQNAVAWFYLAESLDRRGDPAGSKEAFRQMQKLVPDFSFELNQTAAALIANGREREGVGLALQALRDPENDIETTKLILAEGFIRLQDFNSALVWLDRVRAPESAAGYWALRGRAYQGLGRPNEAAAAFSRARQNSSRENPENTK